MIIHQPEIKIVEGEVIVSSRVETIAKTPLPKNLWFKYPLEYKEAVSDRTEAFFTTLFLLGMHLNEDVEVRGDVSPRLVNNIEKSSSIYYEASKQSFSRVDYQFDSIKAADLNLKRDIKLSSFSGGIDSFYSFWSHFYPNQSDHPVHLTHGLFILGFDLLLQNKNNYMQLFSRYQKLFDNWGLSLIQCSTNAYSFYQFRVRWGLPLIPTLAGTATALGNQVSKFYQPGNREPTPKNPTNPASFISLLSTETTSIDGHSKFIDRVVKLRKMLDWGPPPHHLRVCLNMDNEDGVIACGKCRKCLNTSLIIYLLDKQNNFPSLKQEFTIINLIKLCWLSNDLLLYFQTDYWKLIKEKKKYHWMLIFWLMVPISLAKKYISKKIVPSLPRHFILFLKNIVYPKQK